MPTPLTNRPNRSWKQVNLAISAAVVAVLLLVASRLVPHIHNFSLINASCLFAGAVVMSRFKAFVVPFAAVFISDFAINNFIYPSYYQNSALKIDSWTVLSYQATWHFIAYGLIVCLGITACKVLQAGKNSLSKTAICSGAFGATASLLFFLISNFGVWLLGDFYPDTLAGLAACFTAAIPFYQSTLVSDLLFTPALFTGWYLLSQKHSLTASNRAI